MPQPFEVNRTREVIQSEFVRRWNFGEKFEPVTESQFNRLETELNTKLPRSYRQLLANYGPLYTPSILSHVVDANLNFPDVQNIDDPDEMIAGTKAYWLGGMPDNLIGIGSDCMGNMICFRREANLTDDLPVLFFDHDFVDVSEIASSFDEFLSRYL